MVSKIPEFEKSFTDGTLTPKSNLHSKYRAQTLHLRIVHQRNFTPRHTQRVRKLQIEPRVRSGTNSTTLSTRSIVVPSSPVARTRCVTVRERRSASCIVGRLGRKGGRGKDGLERRDLRRGVLGDRKLVEVQTSSQSPMARCRSRSVKDEVYCKVIV